MHQSFDDTGTSSRGRRGHMYLVGQVSSPEAHDLRTFLLRNHVPFSWIDVESDGLVRFLTLDSLPQPIQWPVCIFPDGDRLVAPSRADLARKIGLHTKPDRPEYDLAIIGAGPAGLTAAVYAASEGLRTVVVEREAPGGQAGTTSRIENYPGFPEGISGMELMDRSRQQAQRFGAEFVLVNEVAAVNGQRRAPFEFYLLDGSELRCHTTIVATGASYRVLDAPGLEQLQGRGVYYGTAMAEAVNYEAKDVYVVGGGNSAGQTALHLSQFARRVSLLVRGGSLRQSMSDYLITQLSETDNVEVRLRSEITMASGTSHLEALTIRSDGSEAEVGADGLFILIGQRPATDWAEGILVKDRRGFLVTGQTLIGTETGREVWMLDREPLPLETNAPGVFAAGDVRYGSVNRVAWAVGEGAMAVQLVHQYLGKHLEQDQSLMQDLAPLAPGRIALRIPDLDVDKA